MKIWYDTEFLERGPELPISLISIGMVREDGAQLYLINADMSLSNVVRHPWLQMNVVPYLPIKLSGSSHGQLNAIVEWDTEHPDIQNVVAADTMAQMVKEFCVGEEGKAELWAYYGAYDHVVLSQLFGSMTELPAGMPMFTNDVMQELSRLGNPNVLPHDQHINAHRAIDDADWCRRAHEALAAYELSRDDQEESNDRPAAEEVPGDDESLDGQGE
jgi:hypothetical protein